jgi:hypothetical protein
MILRLETEKRICFPPKSAPEEALGMGRFPRALFWVLFYVALLFLYALL